MESLWMNLPYDMVREILKYVDDIDVKISFKIPPKRISDSRIWKLDYLLNSHDGIIYNLESSSLHFFNINRYHIIYRPIELNFYSEGIWYFNLDEDMYNVEHYGSNGEYISLPGQTDSWITYSRVLLKGSGIAKTIR